MATAVKKFAILDFEASSLSEASWPIEIGRAFLASDRVALELNNRVSRSTPPMPTETAQIKHLFGRPGERAARGGE